MCLETQRAAFHFAAYKFHACVYHYVHIWAHGTISKYHTSWTLSTDHISSTVASSQVQIRLEPNGPDWRMAPLQESITIKRELKHAEHHPQHGPHVREAGRVCKVPALPQTRTRRYQIHKRHSPGQHGLIRKIVQGLTMQLLPRQ